MFKPFFIHEHREPGKVPSGTTRGFTAKITPDRIDPAKKCFIQVAFCSAKDQFNKKIGRETAEKKEQHFIDKKLVPIFLSVYCGKVWPNEDIHKSEFYYVYRYML